MAVLQPNIGSRLLPGGSAQAISTINRLADELKDGKISAAQVVQALADAGFGSVGSPSNSALANSIGTGQMTTIRDGEIQPGMGGPPKPKRTISQILDDVRAKKLTPVAAMAELRKIGETNEDSIRQAVNIAFEQGEAARASKDAGDVGATGQTTGTTSAGGGKGMPLPFDPFKSLDVDDPIKAFRRYFGANPLSTGVPLADLFRQRLEQPAAQGFRLSPFLRPELKTRKDVEAFGAGGIGNFLRGGPGGLAFGSGFTGVPSQEEITGALRQASGPLGSMSEAQRAQAEFLRTPTANEAVFQALTKPGLAQLGEYWSSLFQSMYQRIFDQYQQENQDRSFLESVMAAGAGSPLNFLAR